MSSGKIRTPLTTSGSLPVRIASALRLTRAGVCLAHLDAKSRPAAALKSRAISADMVALNCVAP